MSASSEVVVASNVSTPTTKRPTTPKKGGSRSGVRKDIGMLMFLLAAETAVVSTITDSPAAAHLAATSATSSATTDTAGKNGMTFTTGPQSESSQGETDSADSSKATPTPEGADLTEDDEILDLDALRSAGPNGKAATRMVVMDGAIMSKVLGYVPWKEVARLRGVNKAWLHASEQIVQIRHLPGTTTNAAFLMCPKNLDSDKDTETALQFLHPSTWRCVVCGFWNAETRVLCGNRQCQSPSLTHAGCARIFLGQLRRDATVPFIKWLVTRILEAPSELRNVENHRHNVTNRGKGCAWAYFTSDEVAQDLLAYHRRMFLDIVDDNEGVWIVKPDDVDVLHEVASERGYTANRPKSLPRNALVVEPPATGSSQMARDHNLSNLDVQCQYEDAPTPPSGPAEAPAKRGHGRTSSADSTAASVATSEYRHNPYAYAPVSSTPSYSWADNTSTCGNCDTESVCTIAPSVSAPPSYDEARDFMTTAPYGHQYGHAYGSAPHYGGSNSTTYYSTYPYDTNTTGASSTYSSYY